MGDTIRKWCLCRWREGRTAAILASRGTPSAGHQDPITGASFCGPLSPVDMDVREFYNLPAHLRGLGFPRGQIGNVSVFDSAEEAAACASWDGINKTAIDLPAPVDCFHFGAAHYRYWDGKTQIIYDGGDLRQARAERALLIDDLGTEAARHKVSITCRPLWEKMRPYVPTAEQVAMMNAVAERNDLARNSSRGESDV